MPRDRSSDSLKLAHAEEVLGYFQQIEGQFAQVREGLTHLQRLATLGTLASMVAHEYNNILTPIISYAQMALANPDDLALSRKALEKALSGAQRATHISSTLLGFSREQDTRTRAHLPQTVHETLSCLAHDSQDGIELRVDVPEVEVAISPIDLQQVLVNLVLNAKKAMRSDRDMPSNGPAEKDGITAENKGAPGCGGGRGQLCIVAQVDEESVRIDVSDTGRGVPPQIADRVFEPFVTQDSSASPNSQKGTGLGLYICKDLLVNAGGQISFDSKPGQGTTFHIVIPRAKPLRKSA